jgi:hypothetical protein
LNPLSPSAIRHWCALFGVFVGGCAAPPAAKNDALQRDMLAMVLPAKIEVVAPFTRVGNFDGRPGPDGIELVLRAVNPLGDTGVMIVGDVRVELYEFIAASANRKGRRLEHWNVPLRKPDDQSRYWNRLTQMYEFRLGLNLEKLVPAERYVVYVTYSSPLGEHITAEHVLDVAASEQLVPSMIRQSGANRPAGKDAKTDGF